MNASVMIQWSLLESKNRRINKTRTLIPFSLSSTVHFSLSLSSTVHFFHPSLRSFSLFRLVFSLFSLSLLFSILSLTFFLITSIHSFTLSHLVFSPRQEKDLILELSRGTIPSLSSERNPIASLLLLFRSSGHQELEPGQVTVTLDSLSGHC